MVEKFFSARLNKSPNHNNDQNTIDNLMNALEAVNNQAKKGGFGQEAESRAGNMLNAIRTQDSLHKTNFWNEEKFRETPIVGGSRQVSKLKAELVRNNIVTRANLIKLYQPPAVHKMPTPHQNPFYNGEIVYQSQASQQSSRILNSFLEKDGKSAAANLFGKQSADFKSVTADQSDGLNPFNVGKIMRRSSQQVDKTRSKLRSNQNSQLTFDKPSAEKMDKLPFLPKKGQIGRV